MALSFRRELRPKDGHVFGKEGIHAEHVYDALWQGVDDQEDVLLYAREHERIIVTSDGKDFEIPSDAHAGIVIIYDDTMSAYQVAAGLISMVDAYQNRESFGGREELDPWV